VIVEYVVEGGFPNLVRSVVVHEDGAVDVLRGGARSSKQLSAAQVQQLVSALEATGLFDADQEFPAAQGADLQRYLIRFRRHTVIAYDTTVPPRLAEVVGRLEELAGT
jgi:hypothetical protein